MLTQEVLSELKRLSEIFNAGVRLTCDVKADFKSGVRQDRTNIHPWRLEIDKQMIGWASHWSTHGEGTPRIRQHSSRKLHVYGETPEEAVANLKKYTVENGGEFLLSSQSYGLFNGEDDPDGPHMIQHWKGAVMMEQFPYDENRIREILTTIDPVGAAKEFGDHAPA